MVFRELLRLFFTRILSSLAAQNSARGLNFERINFTFPIMSTDNPDSDSALREIPEGSDLVCKLCFEPSQPSLLGPL